MSRSPRLRISRLLRNLRRRPKPATGTVKIKVDTSAWDEYLPRFKRGVLGNLGKDDG